ncbi:TPA: O76 family O-antigen flippase [Escherichia coli]|uniref:O76 family O-antigen flippase n=1 Tax=Escherichia coli TaxID=562 RepID=UPI0019B3B838|nr:O76 family O-antigen flippase [Escherichia coli]HAN7883367.1 O76 family O-antigen flippase [Escherichia coli]HAW3216295.1 O76 family O-antigen flippase [Escherichia coli]HCS7274229.1 O76 family O-antigen flippase [Escherichia coli]HDP6542278.1 O76 family O-antigen flippase [Escherichia coli]HDP7255334.1 O76 family O-antigen flippase [Escherichia coli]
MNHFKNTILFSIERLLRAGLGFVVSIMITKAYGVEVYGEYAYYFAIINILGVALSLGLDDYFVKCAAESHKVPIKLLYIRIVLNSLSFIFCGFVLYWKKAGVEFWLLSLLSLTYIWNCFYLLLIVLDRPNKHKSILTLITINLLFLILKFLLINYGFIVFIVITLIETLTVTVFLYISIRCVFHIEDINLYRIKGVFKISIPVGISSLSIMLFYRLDQMIVEHYMGVKALGIYALSASMILAAGYLQSTYVTGMYSSIGAAKNNTDQRDMHKVLLKAYRGAICIGIIVYIGYITVGRIIIKHIFNEISFDLISLLDIGMISILFSGLTAINSQYLFVQGYSSKRLLRTLICLLFNISWNIILIPKFGIMTAVWGYVITQIIMGVLFNIFDKVTRQLFILQFKSLFIYRVNNT